MVRRCANTPNGCGQPPGPSQRHAVGKELEAAQYAQSGLVGKKNPMGGGERWDFWWNGRELPDGESRDRPAL